MSADVNRSADEGAVDLSVVVPCFNEEARLAESLPLILEYLQKNHPDHEIVIVDDGSRDRTADVAATHGGDKTRVLRLGVNRGKGAAVRVGMIASRGRRVLFTDADLSTPITELATLEAAMGPEIDVVVGSRALAASRVLVHQPWWRERLGRLFNNVIQALGAKGIKDTQCGFKLFRGKAAHAIFERVRIDRWAFDVEALMVARWLGFRIVEVPVLWRNSRDTRVSVWRDSLRTIWDLLRIWANRRRWKASKSAGPKVV